MERVISLDFKKTSGRSARQKQNSNRRHYSVPSSRYSARYLILVYSQTSARFDGLEVQRLVSRWQAQCAIVQQPRANGTFNYYAFVDFVGKRFQTRNLKCFDIQGTHPRWLHLSSSPWRHLDQMLERGEVIWNGISRPTEHVGQKQVVDSGSIPPSMPIRWDLVTSTVDEATFLDKCEGKMRKETFDVLTELVTEQTAHVSREETEMSRNVRYWQDGYRAGYEAGFSISSNSQTTETEDTEADAFSQIGDDQPVSSLRHDTAVFSVDEPLSAAIQGVADDIPQLDWGSFELDSTSFSL